MYNEAQAKLLVEKDQPGTKAIECVPYEDLYLVRVTRSWAGEENYDPFYSVDPETGEVNEFSIMTDGDPISVAVAFESRRRR